MLQSDGWTNKFFAFRGITHTSSPDRAEYAGGFFDSNDNKYFLFNCFINSSNSAFDFRAKGTGFNPEISIYCDKNTTGGGAIISHDGAKVDKPVDGWCTVQLEVHHIAGSWADFLLNFGGATACMRNLYYSKTAVFEVNPFSFSGDRYGF